MAVVGLFWDFWLVIIGAFVFVAATQEERVTTYHQWLRGIRVCDLMRSGVTSIDTDQPAGLAAGWWAGPQVVTLDGRYYGYYGLADGAARQAAGPGRTVGEFADREAPTLSPSEDLPPVRVGRTGQLGLPGPGCGRMARLW